MANQELLRLGPFEGVNLSKDVYYLSPGEGATAANVDVSNLLGAFSTAWGRTLLGTINVPNGYTIQGIAQFNSFYGDNPLVAKRLYVFSAVNASGATYQGFFDPSNGSTTQLPYAGGFTQAVQFGASLWTNGGDRIQYLNGVLQSDAWQITVPYQYSYNLIGTYATTAGNAPVDTYTYAITLRKAIAPWPQTGTSPIIFSPDLGSLQESSPVFTTSVTISSGQQPGFYANANTPGLAALLQGVTIGGQQYYGCLYRSRNLDPTFVFVDYLVNLSQINDHAGNASIIDTYADATIANNADLTIHHDVPPMLGQTYPGAVANNSTPTQLQQSNQSVSFTYKNPAFLTKHKGRMWAFTLYPAEPIGTTPPTQNDSIALQPQVWCSDYGVPWSFNDDPSLSQVALVGPEDTPGNGAIDATIWQNAPWAPGTLEDTPMGIGTTGAYLCLFKSSRFFIGLGDTPSEFIVENAFDVGCVSSLSITNGLGGVFWLAPEGVYFFNGGSPEYVSEDVRGYIESLPWAHLQAAVGAYSDRTFYLSFANEQITLAYYVPNKKWYTLPYGGSLAVSSGFNQNALIFVSGTQLHAYQSAPSSDLGTAVSGTWNGPVSSCGAKAQLKSFEFLKLVAPVQQGTATVTLVLDANAQISNTYTAKFDLSKGNGEHVARLPAAMKGYTAQLTVTGTTVVGAGVPVIIREVSVEGDVTSSTRAPQTTDLITATLNGSQVYP